MPGAVKFTCILPGLTAFVKLPIGPTFDFGAAFLGGFFPLARGVRTDVSAYLQQLLGAGMEEQENRIMLLWLGLY